MKSKKLIGIVAVLAVIAVVFAGSAAAVTSNDNAIYKLMDTNDNQIVKEASLMTMEPIAVDAIYARLTNLDSNALGAIAYRYAMLNAMDTTDFRANLNKNAIGAIVVGLNNMDSNHYGVNNLMSLNRFRDVNSAALNIMDTNTNRAMLNSNFLILPATSAMLTNLGTNQYGSYYLSDLSRFADVNSAALNIMDTNTNQVMLNSNFLILPATLTHLNKVDTNQYGYFNLANLNRAADVNSFAISVADLSRFALNSGNLAELTSFLNRLNDTNTNSATTTLRADLNRLNTNLNAETNTTKNLSESSDTMILGSEAAAVKKAEKGLEFGKVFGSESVSSDTSSKNLSEASGTIITPLIDWKMDLVADVSMDASEIRIRG